VLKDILVHNKKYAGSPSRLLYYDDAQLNRLWREAIFDLSFVKRLESKMGERSAPKTLKTLQYIKDMGLQE